MSTLYATAVERWRRYIAGIGPLIAQDNQNLVKDNITKNSKTTENISIQLGVLPHKKRHNTLDRLYQTKMFTIEPFIEVVLIPRTLANNFF